MALPTVMEDGWRESVDRNSHSGNSHLREERREDSGLCVIIDCKETHHRRDAEIEVDVTTVNGMHMRGVRHLHLPESDRRLGISVISRAAAYANKLKVEIGESIYDHLKRKLLGQYP